MRCAVAVLVLWGSASPLLARTTVADYLALDQPVASMDAANAAFAAAFRRATTCPRAKDDAEPHVRCLLEALNGELPVGPSGDGRLATLLLDRRADPYSLVAALLLLHGDPLRLDAVVLGERVLLAVRGDEGAFYDPANGGRRITLGFAFATYGHELMRAERADVDKFLGYYAGHLAVMGSSEAHFRAAVKRAPDSARLRRDYGVWLLAQNRLEDARDELVDSTRLGPDDFTAWIARGTVHRKLDKLKPARRCFQQALRLDPRSKAATDAVAELDAEIGRRAEQERLE